MKAGGIIAYIIAGLGVLAALLLLIRGLSLTYFAWLAIKVRRWVGRQTREITAEQKESLLCLKGPHARVLAELLQALPLPRQAQMDAFNQSFLAQSPHLDRCGALILVLAAIAPLLGYSEPSLV